MFPDKLIELGERLVSRCSDLGIQVTTAESCTGGLIAACLTEVPGTSNVFERAIVAYENDVKIALLGVPKELIIAHGAVSQEVAVAMAIGALAPPIALTPPHTKGREELRLKCANLALSVTGIAGPGGGSDDKPVGLIHVAAALSLPGTDRHDNGAPPRTCHERHIFSGTRSDIRLAAVEVALNLGIKLLTRES